MTKLKSCVCITNLKNNEIIAEKCVVADSFFVRLKGLIGKKELKQGDGMLFPSCNSIHMWFMRFSIDVIFAIERKSSENQRLLVVNSIHSNVPAWKILPLSDLSATHTIEVPSGVAQALSLTKGDTLCIS